EEGPELAASMTWVFPSQVIRCFLRGCILFHNHPRTRDSCHSDVATIRRVTRGEKIGRTFFCGSIQQAVNAGTLMRIMTDVLMLFSSLIWRDTSWYNVLEKRGQCRGESSESVSACKHLTICENVFPPYSSGWPSHRSRTSVRGLQYPSGRSGRNNGLECPRESRSAHR